MKKISLINTLKKTFKTKKVANKKKAINSAKLKKTKTTSKPRKIKPAILPKKIKTKKQKKFQK